MNKLVILAKNPHTYFIRRLMEEAGERELVLLDPWSSKSWPHDNHSPILVRTTAIHGSDDDLDFLANHQLQSFPSQRAMRTLRTKPLQFEYFAEQTLPFVPWISLLNQNEEQIRSFCKIHPGPLLIKPHRGQGGWGVNVFKEVNELLDWMNSTTDHEYLLQPYLGDHQELRIFFKNDEYICLERIKKSVAANFKQDGEACEVPAPYELVKMVDQIRRDLDLVYGAADFLIKHGHPYLLEMNLVPGIEQLELITGRNIAKELWEIFAKP